MKIVVTGASGFIGRSLLARLAQEENIEVLGLSRHDVTDPSLLGLCEWASTDYSEECMKSLLAGANLVIHLAGIKGTKTELSDYDVDMQMTENILSAMSSCGVSRIIYASSRLVYGNPETCPWTEETAPEPVLAYAKNKLRCESLCNEWTAAGCRQAVIVRIAQVLGVGEGTRNMINVFLETAQAGGELKVIGKSVARRQYIYTKDLAEVMCRLSVVNEMGCDIINAGMTQAYTNLEIARSINNAFHNNTPISYDDSQPETITQSIMDVNKMIQVTEYTPMNIDQALADMFANY